MLRYEIYRPKVAMSAIESEQFIPGADIAEIMGGNYINVSHIEKFHNMVKNGTQILIEDIDPDFDIEDNDLFPGVAGVVVLVKGLCDAS